MLLDQRLREEISQIVSDYPDIACVILFGSRARGDADPRSDIDLAIKAPQMPSTAWVQLIEELEEELDTLLLIDIVKFENASNALQKNILKEGKMLYEQKKGGPKH